ncbi:hypothetical protein F503_06878 [Ophiostoma piceae UAMH 11346]|uniref:DUF4396 domain-containing protein n=1 Tax=Ophiostoma piceae (strain UAMH 11346) TaxID=1262450 RepID=S3C8D1_OPHP1|nr:hypothetical protein F503_06878 [Ophiostoma piceae UAMH 11346]
MNTKNTMNTMNSLRTILRPRACAGLQLQRVSPQLLPLRLSSTCHKSSSSSPPPTSIAFWQHAPTWRRAGVNTLRCLIGCSVGDFAAMWYLQTHHADLGMWPTIMGLAVASGLASSITLETFLLKLGKDRLPLREAARTAVGMSFISMVTMEVAENAVDYHLMGGVVAFDEPAFWGAALVSMGAGFLAPLPYNYLRLRKHGKSCH